jgi:hypothetical protein
MLRALRGAANDLSETKGGHKEWCKALTPVLLKAGSSNPRLVMRGH